MHDEVLVLNATRTFLASPATRSPGDPGAA